MAYDSKGEDPVRLPHSNCYFLFNETTSLELLLVLDGRPGSRPPMTKSSGWSWL